MKPDVVVVGAGPAGLAAAYHLRNRGAEVVVCEASDRVGGLIRTELRDGYVIEHGAESIITTKPEALELSKELGLEPRIIRTKKENRGAYVVRGGRLVRIPRGFNVVAPASPWGLLQSDVLSWGGKARAALDVVLPRGSESDDESLGHFVRRRFGPELLERLAQPMAAGIYGAHPSRLSLRATMPRFLDLEATARSVTLGLMRQVGAADVSGARYGLFINYDDGSEVLTHELHSRLSDVRLDTPVLGIETRPGGYTVVVQGGERLDADAVVLAVPAWRAANLIRKLLPRAAAELRSIPYGSAATVTMAWPREHVPHALDASGFVCPSVEARLLLAATWSSAKWPGRAPDDSVLIRAFIGGNERDEVVGFEDDELEVIARRGLTELMGIEAPPSWAIVDRYVRAMPRLQTGHLARIDRIERDFEGIRGLAIAGGYLRGVGIPDTLASGRRAAESVARPGRRQP